LEAAPPLPSHRLPATSWMHYTTSCNAQSSAPEDGRNYRPKHVDLIGIINKLLLLHLVGCLYYLYQWCTVKQTWISWSVPYSLSVKSFWCVLAWRHVQKYASYYKTSRYPL